MAWRPIITDTGRRARILAAVADIAEATRTHAPARADADEPSDHALLRAERWVDIGLSMRNDRPLAGFPACGSENGVRTWDPDATLLTGAPGVALVLHAAISELEPSWDRLLLVDLPPQ